MVESVRISIDAVHQDTYQKVRLFGDWEKLMTNLDFISDLRRQGVINLFWLSFVVQRENFREMPAFAQMAEALGCDNVIFEHILNWNTMPLSTFNEQAVHIPDHPQYQDYVFHKNEVMKNTPPGFISGTLGNA